MADIFNKDPSGNYVLSSPDDNKEIAQTKTGNADWDEYLGSLPEEDRPEALKRLQAPLTGEEEAEKMKRNPDYDVKFQDFAKYEAYKGVQERHLMDDISQGSQGLIDEFAKAGSAIADHPLKALATSAPSAIEALFQGTRTMIGIAAQSQDPSSVFFNMRDVLTGGGTPESRYQQFITARNFNRNSQDLATGKSTMLVDKNYIDHEVTQAMSFIADPSWLIPFGKIAGVGLRAASLGEHLGLAAARAEAIKHLIIGGSIKGAGKAIEVIGGATRNVIDYGVNAGAKGFESVTGIGMKETNAALRTAAVGTTVAELAGLSTGAMADVSGVYIAGTAAGGLGEAISAIGGQVMKGKRGILSYAKAALEADKAILSEQAKSLLKIVNAFDPLVTLSTDVVGGVAHGAGIGAVLGYGNDRSEGLGHGIGAGMVLGAVGAVQGRAFATVRGGSVAERLAIQSKYVREGHLELGNMKEYANYSLLRKFGEMTGTEVLMDGIISTADTLIPDIKFDFKNEAEHQKFLKDNNFDPETGRHRTDPSIPDQPSVFDYKNSNGLVMESRNGEITMHINTERISQSGSTVPHELFHLILRKSVLTPKYIKILAGELLGVRDANGKMTQSPSVGIEDTTSFFKEYVKRTYRGSDVTNRVAAIDAALKEYKETGNMTHIDQTVSAKPLLEHMTEEFGAYYFQHLILGERPDWLFYGGKFEGITGVLDRGASAWKDYWYSKTSKVNPQFDFSGGISKGFSKEGLFTDKRIRIPALDYLMQDIVNSTKNLNRSNALDINALNPKTRQTLIDTQGWDALKRERGGQASVAEIKQARKFAGQQAFKSLMALDPNRQLDGEGNISGRLNEADIDNLVRTGHMSRAMGEKVLTLQRLADVQGRRPVIRFGYLGDTQQYLAGNDQPRLTGKDVSYTNREVVLLGFDTKIGKDGKYQFMARTLDVKVIEARGNNLWSQGSVRDLWNGSRADFDSDFLAYLSNASKDGNDVTRRPSAEILPNMDGNGALRRDILHQMSGFVKESSEAYYNKPITEISADYLATYTHFSAENMGKITETGERWDYNHNNAFRDIGKNFMPSEIPFEDTPNGKVFTHMSGFKFFQPTVGKSDAYDADGLHLGSFNTIAEATFAGKVVYAKQMEGINNVVREIKRQNDNGISYMPKEEFIKSELESNKSKYIQNFLRGYKAELGKKIKGYAPAGDELSPEEHFNKAVQFNKDATYAQRRLADISLDVGADILEADRAVVEPLRTVIKFESSYPHFSRDPVAVEKYNKAKEFLSTAIDQQSGKSYMELVDLKSQRWKDELSALKGSKTINGDKAFGIDRLIRGLEEGSLPIERLSVKAGLLRMDSLREEIYKDQVIANNKWEDKYKMSFRSNLKDRILKLTDANPNMTVDKLRSLILTEGSRGGKLWSEAKAMGLIDYLESKMRIRYTIRRRLNAEGKPYARGTGEYDEVPAGKLGDAKIDVQELTDFINNNEIKITIDEGAKSHNVSDTKYYTFAGDKSNYHETAIRINSQYAHGVEGHYGGNTLVHHRGDIRFDSQGNKYLYIEEIQSNNKDDSGSFTYIKDKSRVPLVSKFLNEDLTAFQDKYSASEKHIGDVQNASLNYELSDITDYWRDTGNGQKVSAGERTSFTENEIKKLQKIGTKLFDYRVAINQEEPTLQDLANRVFSSAYSIRGQYSAGGKIAKKAYLDAMEQHRADFLREFTSQQTFLSNRQLMNRYHQLESIADWVESGAGNEKYISEKFLGKNDFILNHLLLNDRVEIPKPLEGLVKDHWMGEYGRYSSSHNDALYETAQRAWGNTAIGANEKVDLTHANYNDFSEFSHRRVEETGKSYSYENDFIQLARSNPELSNYINTHPYMENRVDSRGYSQLVVASKHIPSVINDFKSAMLRDIATIGENKQYPLQELQEWAKLAIISSIREAIRSNIDKVALTHPDDAPSVSQMDYSDRHGLYGKSLPSLYAGFLKKFGIEIETGAKFNQDIAGHSSALAGLSTDAYKANKAVLEWYKENGLKQGLDVRRLSEYLATPIHKMNQDFAIDVDAEISNKKYPAEFQTLIDTAVKAKEAEHYKYLELKDALKKGYKLEHGVEPTEGKVMSEYAISRATRFTLNDKIKEAFLKQDDNQIFKAYMPKEDVQGGRTYDYNSRSWLGGFIGRYAAENPERLQDKNLEFIDRGTKYGTHNVRIRLQDNSVKGKTEDVGHITADIDTKTKVASLSSNIGVKYRGNKLSYVLYSEMAERLRSMGVEKVDGTIINPEGIPIKVRERIIGDTRVLSSDGSSGLPIDYKQGSRIIQRRQAEGGNTWGGLDVVNKLEQNKWYMPAEYQGGDDYYKPKKNKFESKDDLGLSVRQFVIQDKKGNDIYNPDPNALSYVHIGHGLSNIAGYQFKNVEIKGKTYQVKDVMYFIDDKGKFVSQEMHPEATQTHTRYARENKLKTAMHPMGWDYADALQGRVEMPIYEKGKLVRRGVASIIDFGYDKLNDASDVKKAKGVISERLKISEEDFDLYLFGAKDDIKAQRGYGTKDNLPIKFMPKEEGEPIRLSGKMKTISTNKVSTNQYEMDEGNRTYNTDSRQWTNGFIGRYAEENPILTKGIKLSMKNWDKRTDDYGRRSIELKEGNNLIGRIDYEVKKGSGGKWLLSDPTVRVWEQYRGKGYSNLLYSEMAERARFLGAEDFLQRIENDEAIPMFAQVKTFGFGESKLIDADRGQYFPPTKENFDKLKNPDMDIQHQDGSIETVKGYEPWVHSWSKIFPDRWYMPRELAVSGQNPNVKRSFLDYIKSVPHLLKAYTEGQKPEGEQTQNYLTIDQFKPENYRLYHFLSHGPDTASTVDFVDALSGETLHRGQGGGNYPSLFPDKGWASTKGMGKSMADEINAIGERNLKERGEWIAPVALLKSDPWKMRGTVNGANGYINTINKLSERGVLTRKQFKDAIGSALITDKMKEMGVNKKTLGIDFKNSTETQVVDALRKLISNQDMPIATRKVYIEKINAEVFNLIKDKVSKAEGTIPTLKGKTITQGEAFGSALFEMFEDPMTQHAKQGEVYMTLLIRHPVKGESSLQHASYQDTVRTVGGEPIQQDWLSKPIDPKDLFKQRFTKGSITDEAPSGLIDLRPDKDSSFTLFTGQTRQPYQAVKAYQPNEGWRQWTPEKTASGIIYRNLQKYSIMLLNNKFKVYNPDNHNIGIYDTLATAQKRVQRDEPKAQQLNLPPQGGQQYGKIKKR